MGILRNLAESLGMPSAKNKAQVEARSDIGRLSPEQQAQVTKDVRAVRERLDAREKKSFFHKAFASRPISRTQKKGEGIRYALPGGISYRISKYGGGGRGGRTPGRPRQSFKPRVNPFTGQLVNMPALAYYKLVRKYNQALRGRATGSMQAQQAQLARRGVPPSVAAQMIAQGQAQALSQVQPQQMPTQQVPVQQMPQEQVVYVENPVSAVRQRPVRFPFQRRMQAMPRQLPIPQPAYRQEIDIMTGRPRLAPNWARPNKERWVYD